MGLEYLHTLSCCFVLNQQVVVLKQLLIQVKYISEHRGKGFFTQFLDKIMEDLELSEKQKPFVGQR